ncbi:SgcJ/EcaC family oxidoreductase [Nonomuraea sp. B12E4]|uniref:SgcJ/EcaC family oxidoreductase n=1 Tax=Nonomuraea sp. B12E4 TaxID=3153564 RepID=UPI00325E149B
MTANVDVPAREAEIEAIKRVVATVEHAQNNELPDEFLGLFRADAVWTTGGGKRLFGLDEIAAFTRQVLPGGMEGMSVTFEPARVGGRQVELDEPPRRRRLRRQRGDGRTDSSQA